MGIAGYAGSILTGLASAGLFVRECGRRSKQLARIEKELNAENLQVRLPANALASMPYGRPESLLTLKRTSSPPRIIAVCGTASQLEETLVLLRVLGKRLKQSSTFVVAVPVDASRRSDWGISKGTYPWLAEAYDIEEWKGFFDHLSEGSSDFRWFGLNSNGRSFGSGSGESPQWLQVLGQYLRPTEMLYEQDDDAISADKEVASIVECQRKFYTALTTGDQEVIAAVYSSEKSSLVSEVVAAGGRMDDWKACLEDGARPRGMKVSGSDALVISDSEAYSTAIEFPANTGMDSATLLAVQKWSRSLSSKEWKLELHQTIPWSSDARAQGTLLCDCRGCVALTRNTDRRIFGGLIG